MPTPSLSNLSSTSSKEPGAPLGFRLGLVRPRPVFQQRGQQVSHHRRHGGSSLSRPDSGQPVGFVVDRHTDGLHQLPHQFIVLCFYGSQSTPPPLALQRGNWGSGTPSFLPTLGSWATPPLPPVSGRTRPFRWPNIAPPLTPSGLQRFGQALDGESRTTGLRNRGREGPRVHH